MRRNVHKPAPEPMFWRRRQLPSLELRVGKLTHNVQILIIITGSRSPVLGGTDDRVEQYRGGSAAGGARAACCRRVQRNCRGPAIRRELSAPDGDGARPVG